MEFDEDRVIIEAVINLAASLGVEAIAEGVETSEQADTLREMNCGLAQGFHFARPVAPDEIAEMLAAQGTPEGLISTR
jgi:EAL domain-containing protein (putative c-di-GMP-specific phosphodiesterase class I)